VQQFLSDNVNLRIDRWGGSVENQNRVCFPVEV
jgi:2,4-dienoyl-CoA reductase-like NADH-dependent reductase (Old Yellow Enzyme family)